LNIAFKQRSDKTTMIVSFFHVTVPAERAADFERSWTQRAGMVDKMAGFQGMEVLRSGDQPGTYVVVTRWDSREQYDAWANSPAFTAGHARTNAGESGNPHAGAIEFFEVVPSTPAGQSGT
jgi:heme-degrading monooxygenase HmoA